LTPLKRAGAQTQSRGLAGADQRGVSRAVVAHRSKMPRTPAPMPETRSRLPKEAPGPEPHAQTPTPEPQDRSPACLRRPQPAPRAGRRSAVRGLGVLRPSRRPRHPPLRSRRVSVPGLPVRATSSGASATTRTRRPGGMARRGAPRRRRRPSLGRTGEAPEGWVARKAPLRPARLPRNNLRTAAVHRKSSPIPVGASASPAPEGLGRRGCRSA
jgi:hypothetical protein